MDFTPSGAECDNDGSVSQGSCTNNTPRTSGIEAIKQGVSIEDVAREYGEFKLAGAGRLLGRCVSPDHEDRTPSLTVWPETGTFRCFGCQAHGDVLDLEGLAGRHADTWTAMVALSERYAVKLPGRSETWHKNQNTKAAIRDEMRRALTKVYQRRFFRLFHDPGAHPDDDAALWDGMYKSAYLAATRRVFG